jgi:hypothetical protein
MGEKHQFFEDDHEWMRAQAKGFASLYPEKWPD